jgi:hypothetical protein
MKIKRTKIKLWWNNLFKPKVSLTSEQEKVIKIVKKYITDYSTKIECTPLSSDFDLRYLIIHNDVTIKITNHKIFVVNGVYKYEVLFKDNDPSLTDLIFFINKTINRRMDKIESEMNRKIDTSLTNIIIDKK